ncbi:hypothetical protein C2S53_013629 [Perilla frutescens var. hirtella]|uniref:Secreted protein n=1 Tax=Perilla frutescens var. hirtella TaxID=608512 RepID=A0AAD4IR63_PERFH|nr:hypothetical protein C2S53_013629 [Perilla frutescens var. hirtella]
MEGFGKVVVILTLLLGALTMDVNGARTLKTFGSFGGAFPTPAFTGSFPSPGSFAFGSSSFCSLPGVQCTPIQPSGSFGSNGGPIVAAGSP